MPVDPDMMPGAKPSGAAIEQDRPCVKCGYNLVGLDTEGACPECGTPITRRRKGDRFNDNLVNAPIGYLEYLAAGLGGMGVVIVGTWALWVGVWAGMIPKAAGAVAAIVLAMLWFGATWVATMKRPISEHTARDDILDSKRLRAAARLAQGVGVGAVLADAVAVMLGPNSSVAVVFGVLSGLLAVASLFGLVPLGIYLSSLADWAGETTVGSRLRASAWCIAVCGTLLIAVTLVLLMPLPFRLLFAIMTTVLSIAVLIGLVLFCVSILQLVNTAVWAIMNWNQSRAREARIAARKRAQAESDAARADQAASAIAEVANPHQEAIADDDSPIPVEGLEPGEDPVRESEPDTGTDTEANMGPEPQPEPQPTDPEQRKPRRGSPARQPGGDAADDLNPYDLEDED